MELTATLLLQGALSSLAVLSGCAGEASEVNSARPSSEEGAAETAAMGSSVLHESPSPTSLDGGSSVAPPGGSCEYVTTEGTAVIESIETADESTNRCSQDPVTVKFRFEPDDPDAGARGALATRSEGYLTVHAGAAPPRACITGAGIQVGSRLRVKHNGIVKGTCSPVTFRFDEALTAACSGASCFGGP